MVSPLVAIVVVGESAAADGASGPLVGALGVAARAAGASPVPVPVPVVGTWVTADVGDVITLVPVPGSVLVPEKNNMIPEARQQQLQVGSKPQARSARCKGAQQLPSCWCPYRVECEL